jgi:hypothetical protein
VDEIISTFLFASHLHEYELGRYAEKSWLKVLFADLL